MAKMKYYKPKFKVRLERVRLRTDDEVLVGLLTRREMEKARKEKLRKLIYK